jgi:hypothetical protein
MTGSTVKCVSTHIEDLDDGRTVEPGQVIKGVDPTHPHNKRLLDERKLIFTESSEEPTLPELRKEAKALKVEGYSDMNKPELVEALAKAKAEDQEGRR